MTISKHKRQLERIKRELVRMGKEKESKQRKRPLKVAVYNSYVWVTIADGRVIGLPLSSFPWLDRATPEQQQNCEISPICIYWPDLEDGIDLEYFTGEWPLNKP